VIYLAASVWLSLVVLLAWGIRHVCGGLVGPRAINLALLPGTLLSQLGCIVAVLLTGGSGADVSFLGEDADADEAQQQGDTGHVPFFRSLLVGLLPMVLVGTALGVVLMGPGAHLLGEVSPDHVAIGLPVEASGFWTQLRHLVTLAEETMLALEQPDWNQGATWLLMYLIVSFVVQLAPSPRYVHGRFYAIVAFGGLAALAGTLLPGVGDMLALAWSQLAFILGLLLLLMMLSLLVRGSVAVIRDLTR